MTSLPVLQLGKAVLTGRPAIVTGAGAGIGRGIAFGLAAFGARIAILEVQDEAARRTKVCAFEGVV